MLWAPSLSQEPHRAQTPGEGWLRTPASHKATETQRQAPRCSLFLSDMESDYVAQAGSGNLASTNILGRGVPARPRLNLRTLSSSEGGV